MWPAGTTSVPARPRRLEGNFCFAAEGFPPHGCGMKFHEWFERDEAAGERRYFRAGKFGKNWHVKTTLKSAPDWDDLDPVPRDILEALREQLMNKYQRRRIPYEDVVAIDKMVVAAGGVTVIHDLDK